VRLGVQPDLPAAQDTSVEVVLRERHAFDGADALELGAPEIETGAKLLRRFEPANCPMRNLAGPLFPGT